MNAELPLDDYLRYGRQMIIDGFGLPGQLKLQQSSVVVVGAGGLGCPALQYLAAAGIGHIAIIDHDIVEPSNLHRQILHTEQSIGLPKAQSAAHALLRLNSRLKVTPIITPLLPSNASSLLTPYALILDCTDNTPTRYLLSDTAVLLSKPLISGAAQKYEGQLVTYNLGPSGPCYRCLFPIPPSREMTGSCEELGILGAVTGVIGSLQALEAIKIITGLHDMSPSLLLFSCLTTPSFRSVKLRKRKPTCAACGYQDQKIAQIEDIDYVQFCGGTTPDWVKQGLIQGDEGQRIYPKDLKAILDSDAKLTIIDVRPRTEFGICQLPNSINIPLNDLVANPASHLPESTAAYIVCRLGNDSRIAADALRSVGDGMIIKDVIGGLRAWTNAVDPEFPVY